MSENKLTPFFLFSEFIVVFNKLSFQSIINNDNSIKKYFSYIQFLSVYLQGSIFKKIGKVITLILLLLRSFFYITIFLIVKNKNDQIYGIALASIPRLNPKVCSLEAISVNDILRNHGVGSFMLSKLEEYCTTNKCILINLKTKRKSNHKAIMFYTKNKFLIKNSNSKSRYIYFTKSLGENLLV